MSEARWRPLLPDDLATVVAIAAAVHPGYPEDEEVFAERLALFPEGCRLALIGEEAVGYAIAHPWMHGDPPTLNTLLRRLPERPDCLYLHDVALLAHGRGAGLGWMLLQELRTIARSRALPRLALVAVKRSAAYWTMLGFHAEDDPRLAAKLASYGGDARYMTRSPSPGGTGAG